jgi:sugar phosphate isomerase/epimerase
MKQLILLLLSVILLACTSKKKELDNTFYPFNNALTLPNAPQGFDNQAEFINELGFDGFGGHSRDDYFKRRASLNKVGLSIPELYWSLKLDSTGSYSYNPEIKEIIKDSKNQNLIVTLVIYGEAYENNHAGSDNIVVKAIQELADFAAPYGVRIAAYPHVNVYCETVAHSVRIAKMAKRDNVGSAFNLCHFLKKEGKEGWQEKISKALPSLIMVSISGADGGDTQNMNWDQLIQPLGEGTYDTYPLVKYLKDKGYDGPIGLQCYNIKQDTDVALSKSIKTWRSYQKRYAEETN